MSDGDLAFQLRIDVSRYVEGQGASEEIFPRYCEKILALLYSSCTVSARDSTVQYSVARALVSGSRGAKSGCPTPLCRVLQWARVASLPTPATGVVALYSCTAQVTRSAGSASSAIQRWQREQRYG